MVTSWHSDNWIFLGKKSKANDFLNALSLSLCESIERDTLIDKTSDCLRKENCSEGIRTLTSSSCHSDRSLVHLNCADVVCNTESFYNCESLSSHSPKTITKKNKDINLEKEVKVEEEEEDWEDLFNDSATNALIENIVNNNMINISDKKENSENDCDFLETKDFCIDELSMTETDVEDVDDYLNQENNSDDKNLVSKKYDELNDIQLDEIKNLISELIKQIEMNIEVDKNRIKKVKLHEDLSFNFNQVNHENLQAFDETSKISFAMNKKSKNILFVYL